MSAVCVLSLSDLCCRCVTKSYEIEDLVFIVSNVELSIKVVDSLLSYMPINKVMNLEALHERQTIFKHFWSKVVEKCKIKNCAFRQRLVHHKDPFYPPTFDVMKDEKVDKQILLNSLFQEALDKVYYIASKKTRAMPMFPLHVALDDNYPDVSSMDWLLQLTSCISCFHFYPRHAEMLLNHTYIIETMPEQIEQVDLMLNVTINSKTIIFKSFYTVLYSILFVKTVQRVVFCNACFTNQFKLTWELCAGNVQSEYFLLSSKEILQSSNLLKNVDIWELALGGNTSTSTSSEPSSYGIIDIYSDFVEEPKDKGGCLTTENLNDCPESTSKCVAVSEFVLEINDQGFPITSARELFQCGLRHLHKLKIYLLGLGGMHNPSTEQKFVDEIVNLLCHPATQLNTLIFHNFTFYSFCLHKIMKGIVTMHNNTGSCFDYLSFVNCRWQENLSPLGFVYENPCVSCYGKQFLTTLLLQSLLLAHSEGDITQPMSQWQQSFIQTLNPLTIYILGQSSFELNEVAVPPSILQVEILQSVICNKASKLQNVVVYLPTPLTLLRKHWMEILTETFTSCEILSKLVVIFKPELPKSLTKVFNNKVAKLQHLQIDVEDKCSLSSNSIEDHVSEM